MKSNMARFLVGAGLSLEDDSLPPAEATELAEAALNAAVTPADPLVVEQDALDKESDSLAVDTDEVAKATDGLIQLESLVATMEAAIADMKEITPREYAYSLTLAENFYRQIGIAPRQSASLESVSTPDALRGELSLAVEDFKETGRKVWLTIKQALLALIEKFFSLFDRIASVGKTQISRCRGLQEYIKKSGDSLKKDSKIPEDKMADIVALLGEYAARNPRNQAITLAEAAGVWLDTTPKNLIHALSDPNSVIEDGLQFKVENTSKALPGKPVFATDPEDHDKLKFTSSEIEGGTAESMDFDAVNRLLEACIEVATKLEAFGKIKPQLQAAIKKVTAHIDAEVGKQGEDFNPAHVKSFQVMMNSFIGAFNDVGNYVARTNGNFIKYATLSVKFAQA